MKLLNFSKLDDGNPSLLLYELIPVKLLTNTLISSYNNTDEEKGFKTDQSIKLLQPQLSFDEVQLKTFRPACSAVRAHVSQPSETFLHISISFSRFGYLYWRICHKVWPSLCHSVKVNPLKIICKRRFVSLFVVILLNILNSYLVCHFFCNKPFIELR